MKRLFTILLMTVAFALNVSVVNAKNSTGQSGTGKEFLMAMMDGATEYPITTSENKIGLTWGPDDSYTFDFMANWSGTFLIDENAIAKIINDGYSIYCTTDGEKPTTSSTSYSLNDRIQPEVKFPLTVKILLVKNDFNGIYTMTITNSGSSYTINYTADEGGGSDDPVTPTTVAAPVISIESQNADATYGTYAYFQITDATEGATINYSLDGGETWDSYLNRFHKYTKDISGSSYTIMARATKKGVTSETTQTFNKTPTPTYTINGTILTIDSPSNCSYIAYKLDNGNWTRAQLSNNQATISGLSSSSLLSFRVVKDNSHDLYSDLVTTLEAPAFRSTIYSSSSSGAPYTFFQITNIQDILSTTGNTVKYSFDGKTYTAITREDKLFYAYASDLDNSGESSATLYAKTVNGTNESKVVSIEYNKTAKPNITWDNNSTITITGPSGCNKIVYTTDGGLSWTYVNNSSATISYNGTESINIQARAYKNGNLFSDIQNFNNTVLKPSAKPFIKYLEDNTANPVRKVIYAEAPNTTTNYSHRKYTTGETPTSETYTEVVLDSNFGGYVIASNPSNGTKYNLIATEGDGYSYSDPVSFTYNSDNIPVISCENNTVTIRYPNDLYTIHYAVNPEYGYANADNDTYSEPFPITQDSKICIYAVPANNTDYVVEVKQNCEYTNTQPADDTWDYGTWSHYNDNTEKLIVNTSEIPNFYYTISDERGTNEPTTSSTSGNNYSVTIPLDNLSDGTHYVQILAYGGSPGSEGVYTWEVTKSGDSYTYEYLGKNSSGQTTTINPPTINPLSSASYTCDATEGGKITFTITNNETGATVKYSDDGATYSEYSDNGITKKASDFDGKQTYTLTAYAESGSSRSENTALGYQKTDNPTVTIGNNTLTVTYPQSISGFVYKIGNGNWTQVSGNTASGLTFSNGDVIKVRAYITGRLYSDDASVTVSTGAAVVAPSMDISHGLEDENCTHPDGHSSCLNVMDGCSINALNNYITLSAPDNPTIYYTLDGSDPTSSSTRKEYTGKFVCADINNNYAGVTSVTVKAVSYANGKYSSVTQHTYSKYTENTLTISENNGVTIWINAGAWLAYKPTADSPWIRYVGNSKSGLNASNTITATAAVPGGYLLCTPVVYSQVPVITVSANWEGGTDGDTYSKLNNIFTITAPSSYSGGTIYYTTDGTEPDPDPNTSSTTHVYNPNDKPTLSASEGNYVLVNSYTIKAIVVKDNNTSGTATKTFVKADMPVITGDGPISGVGGFANVTAKNGFVYYLPNTVEENSWHLSTASTKNNIGYSSYIQAKTVEEDKLISNTAVHPQVKLRKLTPYMQSIFNFDDDGKPIIIEGGQPFLEESITGKLYQALNFQGATVGGMEFASASFSVDGGKSYDEAIIGENGEVPLLLIPGESIDGKKNIKLRYTLNDGDGVKNETEIDLTDQKIPTPTVELYTEGGEQGIKVSVPEDKYDAMPLGIYAYILISTDGGVTWTDYYDEGHYYLEKDSEEKIITKTFIPQSLLFENNDVNWSNVRVCLYTDVTYYLSDIAGVNIEVPKVVLSDEFEKDTNGQPDFNDHFLITGEAGSEVHYEFTDQDGNTITLSEKEVAGAITLDNDGTGSISPSLIYSNAIFNTDRPLILKVYATKDGATSATNTYTFVQSAKANANQKGNTVSFEAKDGENVVDGDDLEYYYQYVDYTTGGLVWSDKMDDLSFTINFTAGTSPISITTISKEPGKLKASTQPLNILPFGKPDAPTITYDNGTVTISTDELGTTNYPVYLIYTTDGSAPLVNVGENGAPSVTTGTSVQANSTNFSITSTTTVKAIVYCANTGKYVSPFTSDLSTKTFTPGTTVEPTVTLINDSFPKDSDYPDKNNYFRIDFPVGSEYSFTSHSIEYEFTQDGKTLYDASGSPYTGTLTGLTNQIKNASGNDEYYYVKFNPIECYTKEGYNYAMAGPFNTDYPLIIKMRVKNKSGNYIGGVATSSGFTQSTAVTPTVDGTSQTVSFSATEGGYSTQNPLKFYYTDITDKWSLLKEITQSSDLSSITYNYTTPAASPSKVYTISSQSGQLKVAVSTLITQFAKPDKPKITYDDTKPGITHVTIKTDEVGGADTPDASDDYPVYLFYTTNESEPVINDASPDNPSAGTDTKMVISYTGTFNLTISNADQDYRGSKTVKAVVYCPNSNKYTTTRSDNSDEYCPVWGDWELYGRGAWEYGRGIEKDLMYLYNADNTTDIEIATDISDPTHKRIKIDGMIDAIRKDCGSLGYSKVSDTKDEDFKDFIFEWEINTGNCYANYQYTGLKDNNGYIWLGYNKVDDNVIYLQKVDSYVTRITFGSSLYDTEYRQIIADNPPIFTLKMDGLWLGDMEEETDENSGEEYAIQNSYMPENSHYKIGLVKIDRTNENLTFENNEESDEYGKCFINLENAEEVEDFFEVESNFVTNAVKIDENSYTTISERHWDEYSSKGEGTNQPYVENGKNDTYKMLDQFKITEEGAYYIVAARLVPNGDETYSYSGAYRYMPVYYSPSSNWKTLSYGGMRTYRDDIIYGYFYDCFETDEWDDKNDWFEDQPIYSVEVQDNKNTPGLFRVKNMYHFGLTGNEGEKNLVSYQGESPYRENVYFYIDTRGDELTDGDGNNYREAKLYPSEFYAQPLGFDWEAGEMMLTKLDGGKYIDGQIVFESTFVYDDDINKITTAEATVYEFDDLFNNYWSTEPGNVVRTDDLDKCWPVNRDDQFKLQISTPYPLFDDTPYSLKNEEDEEVEDMNDKWKDEYEANSDDYNDTYGELAIFDEGSDYYNKCYTQGITEGQDHVDVTYERNIKNSWGTIMMPFEFKKDDLVLMAPSKDEKDVLEAQEGEFELYELNRQEGQMLVFTSTEDAEANTPIVFTFKGNIPDNAKLTIDIKDTEVKGVSSVVDYKTSGVVLEKEDTPWQTIGAYTRLGVEQEGTTGPTVKEKENDIDWYVTNYELDKSYAFTGNEVKTSTKFVRTKQYRAFFYNKSTNTQSLAKSYAVFYDDAPFTSVTDPISGNEKRRGAEGRYNVAGQKVKNGYRGIVIENGRKRFVK